MAKIDALSLEYVKVPISASEAGLPVDPTEATVVMAFTDVNTKPAVDDWEPAEWETDATRDPDRYLARCLVGAGEVELEAGTYRVWWKITDIAPEAPVGYSDELLVVT